MAAPDQSLTSTARDLTADALRRALGQFPTGVTIVTAVHAGRLVGMTANSFSSVSLEPPLVLWSVAKRSPSHEAFVAADAFAIHLLGADHHDLALRFAGGVRDKFRGVSHSRGVTGAPLIADLAPVFECRPWARHDGGDHTIMVGEVVHLVPRTHDPLLFHSGVLRRIDGSREGARPRALAHASFVRSYLPYLLARADEVASRDFRARLTEWRLTPGEWRILACLSDADGLDLGELAAMSVTRPAAVARTVRQMERAGLVTRRPGTRRQPACVYLTEAGRQRVAPVLAVAKEHEARLLAPLTEEERATLKHALDLLIDRGEKSGDDDGHWLLTGSAPEDG